jgi:hypothetical protein
MESTRKTVKESGFFFFFFFVRSTVNGGGQQSMAAVTRVDVALTSLGLMWQAERKGA